MKNFVNYLTCRTDGVLSKQLQGSWRYVMILAAILVMGSNVSAQTITVDGNPADWEAVYGSGSTVTVKSLKRDANDTNDDQFTEGSQDRDLISKWTWNIGNTNDKGDISNAGAALIGCNLYFFGDRTAINGDAQIGFWFFKSEVAPTGISPGGFSGQHQVGDLLILTHFTNGGGEPTISIYEWVGSGGSHGELNQLSSSAGGAMVNNQLYPVPSVTYEGQTWAYTPKSGGPGYVTGSFFEGSVDLCALFGRVPCFSTFLLETRNAPSENSLQASLQDLAAGEFNITPEVSVDDQIVCEGGTATFTATASGGIGALEYSWKVGNGAYGTYSTNNTLTLNNVTLNMDDTKVYVKVKGGNGCESTPDEGNLTVNPAATANAGADIPVCASDIPAGGVALSGSFGGGASSGSWAIVTGGGSLSGDNYVPLTSERTNGATVTLRYTTNDPAGPCLAAHDDMDIVIFPAATANAGADQTVCEGQTIQLNGSIGGGASTGTWVGGSGYFNPDRNTLNAIYTPTLAESLAGVVNLTLRTDDPTGPCDLFSDEMAITIDPCSKIQLEKLTDGIVDATKSWTFTISEGNTLIATETVLSDADGILFDGLILSKDKTYTICETNVGVSFTVSIKYRNANGDLVDLPWYDPQVVNGGGDFNQGEAVGNYCFNIGAGTAIPLPLNTYGSAEADVVFLEFEINNISPPGGNARTPGYWKNWSSCSGGNQYNSVMAARENGGEKADFWLLDDYVGNGETHTLYTGSTCEGLGSFIISSCQQAVYILNEQQNGGKYAKMSSDAAYKLAKHLLTYQLNKRSGTYEFASAASAATEAEALLAKYCFNGTASSYLSSKSKNTAVKVDYARSLELAKILDAYNNNLQCGSVVSSSLAKGIQGVDPSGETLTAYPTPFSDKATIEFTTSQTENYVVNLYDMRGALVKQLKAGTSSAGELNKVEVDGKDLTEGLYLARVITGSGGRTVKLLLKK